MPELGLRFGVLGVEGSKKGPDPRKDLESRSPKIWGPILLRVLYRNPH